MAKHCHQECDSLHLWLWFLLHSQTSASFTMAKIWHTSFQLGNYSENTALLFHRWGKNIRKGSHWLRLIHIPILRIGPTGNTWSENMGRVDPERRKGEDLQLELTVPGRQNHRVPSPPAAYAHVHALFTCFPSSNPHLPWETSLAFQPTDLPLPGTPCVSVVSTFDFTLKWI